MATRSNVGIINEDGTVEVIYIHWDGYPEYVGALLEIGFHENKVRELLANGDRSSLLDTDKKNSLDSKSRKYNSLAEYLAADDAEAEYLYLGKTEKMAQSPNVFNWHVYKVPFDSEAVYLGILAVEVKIHDSRHVLTLTN